MSYDVVQGVKNLVTERVKDISSLKISWFGGEPLLAKDVILDVSNHVLKVAGCDIVSSGNITTNGFLLDSITFAELLAANVTYFQISLDGLEDAHDRSRITAGGHGTFSQIWSNLLSMKENPASFGVVLRLHYTQGTLASVEHCIEQICKEFDGDKRFSILLKQIEPLGGKNDADIRQLSRNANIEFVGRIRKVCEGKIELATGSADSGSACYASKLNSFVVRSDGRIGKCTVALEDPRNTVGQIFPNGSIAIDSDKLAHWIQGLADSNLDRLLCPLSFLPKPTPVYAITKLRSPLPSSGIAT